MLTFSIYAGAGFDHHRLLRMVATIVQTRINERRDLGILKDRAFFDARIVVDQKHEPDLYAVLKRGFDLSDDDISQIIDMEINAWKTVLASNPQFLDRIRSDSEQVCVIDRSYLPENVIRMILSSWLPDMSEIPVYLIDDVSEDSIAGVVNNLHEEYGDAASKDWIHLGNDPDINGFLESAGAKICSYMDQNRVLSWEEAEMNRDDIAQNMLVEASIRSRSRSRVCTLAESVGASIGFEVLYPYVRWILDKCIESEVTDLFFVARDGYILKRIADTVIDAYEYPITTHYIYGSREAWHLPLGISDTDDVRTRLTECEECIDSFTLNDILGMYGELMLEYYHTTMPQEFRDTFRVWSYDEPGNPISWLNEHPDIERACREYNEPALQMLKSYIDQETGSTGKCAFVEMQGSGRTLNRIANLIADPPLISFYFRKTDSADKRNETSYVYNYGFDKSVNLMLECMTRAPHGVTRGFRREDDRIVPILENDGVDLLVDYGYEDYIKGINRSVNEVLALEKNLSVKVNYDHAGQLFLKYLEVDSIDDMLADFFGEMPFSDLDTCHKFAPRLTKEMIEDKGKYVGYCYELSKKRSKELIRPKKCKVGFTAGAFDLFHTGHLNLIKRCKEQCDYLIVGVMTDDLIRFGKQKEPCLNQEERARIVGAIKYVDEVVLVDFHNTRKTDAWELYHFDCCFTGDDHRTPDWLEEQRILREKGSDIVFFPYTQGISTTMIRQSMGR